MPSGRAFTRRASGRSLPEEASITAAASERFDEWSSARAVGSRGCDASGFATTAPTKCKTRGVDSPLQSSATASRSAGVSVPDRFCQGLLDKYWDAASQRHLLSLSPVACLKNKISNTQLHCPTTILFRSARDVQRRSRRPRSTDSRSSLPT